MADPRTFVLIGNFTDNITPALEKINKSLEQVKSNLESVSKHTKPLQKDFKELANLSNDFAKSLKGQSSDIRDVTKAMKAMRNEMGRVNRAYRAAGRNRNIVPPLPPPPRPPRGAVPPPPPPPPRAPRYPSPGYGGGRGGRGGGYGGGGTGGGGYGAAVGGAVFGTQLSQMMTSAIVAGFQMGTSIMVKPFQYIMSGMAERIADEMSDVRAAGGLFAINRILTEKGKEGFLTGGFREAEEVTKENNRYLAKLAGSLPGDTQEYIQVSKQISDGIYRVLSEDKENFMKLGVKVATEEGRLTQAQEIKAGGTKGMQAAGTEVLGDITKLTVLAGLGGRQGPYGLPQLTERMIAQQEVSMGQMQRYSAIFRDPMIMGALERNISTINKTQANTADRLDKIRGMFQEIVTPELVARYRRTTAGVLESMKTTFLNPEVGLLGLGRPIDGLGKKLNDFGQYLDKQNKVVEDVTLAASADISIFEGLRDTFAFLYQTLEPIIEILPLIYDPLKELGFELEKVREVSASVFRRFNEYRLFFEEMGGEFKGTARLRASLATLTQLFKDFGIFDSADFNRFQEIISGKGFNVDKAGALVQEMLEKFFDSDLAESIGNAIGRLAGTIIKTVGQLAAQAAGIVSSGGIAKGLSEGFEAAGGREGIRLIFKSLIELVLKAVRELFAAAPLEMSLITGFALFGPALAATLGTMLGTKLIAVIPAIAKGLVSVIAASLLKTKAVKVTDLGPVITDPRRMLPPAAGTVPGAIVPAAGAAPAAKGVGAAASKLLGPAAIAAGFIIFDTEILKFAEWLRVQGEKLKNMQNIAANGFAVLVKGLSTLFEGLVNTFKGAFDMIVGLFTGDIEKVKQGFVRMMNGIVQAMGGLVVSVIGIVTTLGGGIIQAIKSLFQAIWEGVTGIKNNAKPEPRQITKGSQSRFNPTTKQTEVLSENGWVPAVARAKGGLGDAVASEMANKPAGSDLVIANSSETVIPAAGGYGMLDFVETFRAGFNSLANVIRTTSQQSEIKLSSGFSMLRDGFRVSQERQISAVNRITSTLMSNQQQTNARLSKLETKFSSPTMPGGLGGGAAGGVDAFTPIAQGMGLTMTSGYRPGDPGWHGANRARDYSNGTGPTPQMLQFAQQMAASYGSNLKELIYTPLGFSIKNGQKVAPYAQGAHYNHVHVAYAMGAGTPAFFNDQKDAISWEKKFLGKGVDSITTNTAELSQAGNGMFARAENRMPSETLQIPTEGMYTGKGSSVPSAPINITAPITITQQPGQSADELASIVALKIGEAVADARAASIFV